MTPEVGSSENVSMPQSEMKVYDIELELAADPRSTMSRSCKNINFNKIIC